MPALLVRHARAGHRESWSGDDALRPLDEKGRRQAEGLVEQLREFPVSRIVSSPTARCVETMEPLARDRGLPVEEREELAEGAGPAAQRLIEELGDGAVLCTHGDVIAELLGPDAPQAKGSTWVLERDGDRFAPARYLKPPG